MMKPMIAIVGDARVEKNGDKWNTAAALGQRLIDEGYRIVTGGLGNLPEAVALGARKSHRYQDGCLVAILPGFDPKEADAHADVVIAAGIDYARNMIVANSDAVVAIGGGAGTLSEIALAWALKRLIIAYELPGWSGKLAGTRIDDRVRLPDIAADRIFSARTDGDVVEILKDFLPLYNERHHGAAVRSAVRGPDRPTRRTNR